MTPIRFAVLAAIVQTLGGCRESGQTNPVSVDADSPEIARAVLPALNQLPTEIRACYQPGSGHVYRIGVMSAPEACRGNHIEFRWNATGGGGSGWEQIRQQIPAGDFQRVEVLCPNGKKAVHSGGFYSDGSDYTFATFVLSNGNGAWFFTAPERYEAVVTCIAS